MPSFVESTTTSDVLASSATKAWIEALLNTLDVQNAPTLAVSFSPETVTGTESATSALTQSPYELMSVASDAGTSALSTASSDSASASESIGPATFQMSTTEIVAATESSTSSETSALLNQVLHRLRVSRVSSAIALGKYNC